MSALRDGILTVFMIGLLVMAAALSLLAIVMLTVSRIIFELAVAIDPDRKTER